jgi:hypothetical protein
MYTLQLDSDLIDVLIDLKIGQFLVDWLID